MTTGLRLVQGGGDTTSRFYTCSICGHRGKWSPSWAWFGSYKELDEKGIQGITLTCSDACLLVAQKEKK